MKNKTDFLKLTFLLCSILLAVSGFAADPKVVPKELGAPTVVPKTFEAEFVGMITSYEVKLQKGVLNCSKRVNGEEKQLKITPTAKQWAEFRRSLDQAGVWQWRTNYQNPSVMDGTAWSLKIEYTSRSVHASGVNRYPDERGKPGEGSDYTKAFDAYVTALHTLTESKFLK